MQFIDKPYSFNIFKQFFKELMNEVWIAWQSLNFADVVSQNKLQGLYILTPLS